MACRKSVIVILYTKPYETALAASRASELCKIRGLNEEMGRVLVDCSNTDIDGIDSLTALAESYTIEAKFKCKGRKCVISGFDDVVSGKPFIYKGRLVVWSKVKGGYELKVGPKSVRPPVPPIPSSVFYVNSVEELRDRIRVLEDFSRRIKCW